MTEERPILAQRGFPRHEGETLRHYYTRVATLVVFLALFYIGFLCLFIPGAGLIGVACIISCLALVGILEFDFGWPKSD